MTTCESYAGSYRVSQTSCVGTACTIPMDASVTILCEKPPKFRIIKPEPGGETTYDAEINESGQLVVKGLSLVVSVTGTAPEKYLFGMTSYESSPARRRTWKRKGTVPEPEVWGAEEEPDPGA